MVITGKMSVGMKEKLEQMHEDEQDYYLSMRRLLAGMKFSLLNNGQIGVSAKGFELLHRLDGTGWIYVRALELKGLLEEQGICDKDAMRYVREIDNMELELERLIGRKKLYVSQGLEVKGKRRDYTESGDWLVLELEGNEEFVIDGSSELENGAILDKMVGTYLSGYGLDCRLYVDKQIGEKYRVRIGKVGE